MTDDDHRYSFVLPDPFGGRVSMHLEGSFRRGGTVHIAVDGRTVDFLPLPRKQWAVLALLVQSVLKSPAIGSFFTSDQLATALTRRNVIQLDDPQIAIRVMYRLRKSLNRTHAATVFAGANADSSHDDFATRVIPTWKVRGYRVSLPLARLSIELSDDD